MEPIWAVRVLSGETSFRHNRAIGSAWLNERAPHGGRIRPAE